jgi:hypothetical protein
MSLRFITIIFDAEYESQGLPLRSVLQSPFTASLTGPNTVLVSLFSGTLGLCYSLNVRNKLPQPYETSRVIALSILIFYVFR